MQLKRYKNDFSYSYALGPFPSFELLKAMPQNVLEVHISEEFRETEKLISLCKDNNIPFVLGDKQINKISQKEKSYVCAVFEKFDSVLDKNNSHIVLHNPSDMGNLGTIIRSMLAFSIKNLAIIRPCADVFNPKVIRASMGAVFKINIQIFDSFEQYYQEYKEQRAMFPFMLTANTNLSLSDCPRSEKFSLIFGNEASGLPSEFENFGTPIFIPQSDEVDSLNLAISVSLASFVFTNKNNNN